MIHNQTGEFQPATRGIPVKQWAMQIDELGVLLPVEIKDVPFVVKRLFAITDCPGGEYRGGHAHKETQQYLFCLQGMIRVLLIDKRGDRQIELRRGCSVHINKMTWDRLQFLTGNDVLLVLCNTAYDKNDYIENFDDFKKMLDNENNSGNDRPE